MADWSIFVVDLIHLFSSPHFDAQVLPDEGEQRGREVDHSLVVDRLVHSDQFFESEPVRTLGPEAQRRIHVLQHVVNLGVVNAAPRWEE